MLGNIVSVAIVIAIGALSVFLIYGLFRKKKQGKSSCGCGCADCPMSAKCHPCSEKDK